MAEQAADIQPGIYFHMEDDVYHSIPALSASGIKNLLVSPMDFWARARWLNPLYEREEDSVAMILGRAYHKRILEGKAAFDGCYAPIFTAPEDCLKTVDDLKEVLKAEKLPVTGKKDDLIDRLLAARPNARIYDLERLRYEERHGGKVFLGHAILNRIEIAAAMIEKHPHLSRCFTGGYPEVSVIWEEDGIRMKARFDYLKPKAIIDLKTFANMMSKPIDRAIYGAMASGKYHIQAAFYLKAAQVARDLPVMDTEIPAEFLLEFSACEEHGFYHIFQQKGIAPLARGFKFPRGMVYGAGVAAIEDAKQRYKECLAKFGADPWLDDRDIETFEDSQFPVYITDL
jgi:hypothetical protein